MSRRIPQSRLWRGALVGLVLLVAAGCSEASPADEDHPTLADSDPASLEHLMASRIAASGLANEIAGSDRFLQQPIGPTVSYPTVEPTPRPEVIRRPVTAQELGISLAPDGQPYESEIYAESARTERVGTFHAPGGTVFPLDGISASLDPLWEAEHAPLVDFEGVEHLYLSIVWSDYAATDAGPGYSSVLGVRLDVPGTTVASWGAFESAYGTDGGLGALVTGSLISHLSTHPVGVDGELMNFDRVIAMEHYLLGDFDQIDGTDLIVFSNGWGDGGFPMTKGFDDQGRLVSLFVLDERRHPWDLVIDEGQPPPDVTERRTQIQECMDGTRDVIVSTYGFECAFDE